MKNKITTIIVFFIPFFCFSQSVTPFVINATGSASNEGYYQFEWSVGEMSLVDEMESLKNLCIVTNGFLQPFLLNPTSFNQDHLFSPDEIRIFPTPASSFVEIDLFTSQQGQLRISFYDEVGQKVYNTQFHVYGIDYIHRIPADKLTAGSYVLQVELDADAGYFSKSGTYKVLKVQ